MPAVTVIIPTYNSARYLAAAVQSVIDQTWTDWELIIVDDGSTDGTADLIAAKFLDPRVRLVRQPNQGDAAARNTGIRLSTSPLLAFLDADDLWRPEKLQQQIQVLRELPDVDVVYCGIEIETITSSGDSLSRKITHPPDIQEPTLYEELLNRNIITGSHSSVMLRRSVLESVGLFDAKYRISDIDLWIRLALRHAFFAIHEALVVIRKHGQNSSSNKVMMSDNHLRFSAKLRSEIPQQFQHHLSPAAIYQFGWLTLGLLRRGEFRQAARTGWVMLSCVIRRPTAIGVLIRRWWTASREPSPRRCDTPLPGLLFPRTQSPVSPGT